MTNDAAASGAPRFDVVLRGYDRKQVDEHVARMQRIIGRMRADLEIARSQPLPVVTPAAPPAPAQQPPGRPRPTPRPRSSAQPDVVGSFTDRMQSILQAAEEEAAEIRKKAHGAAWHETQAARAEVAELARQRDIMVGELNRMRGQLESMLSAPTARMPAHQPAARRPSPGPGTGGQPAVPAPAPRPAPPTGPQPVAPPPPPVAQEPATTITPLPAAPAPEPTGSTPKGKAAARNGTSSAKQAPDVEPADEPVAEAEPVDLFRAPATKNGSAANGTHKDVEATVKVAAVRPASVPVASGDATVMSPVVPADVERGTSDDDADDLGADLGDDLDGGAEKAAEKRDHTSAPSRSG